MSGPLGGGQGRQRMIGKGGRRLATRGFKLGSYVSITYRDPDRAHSAEPNIIYEGKISDKRVGGQDRESYVELKDCLRINEHGQVIAKGDKKRLMDAFIEECEAVEPREDKTPIHEKAPEPEQWVAMSGGQMPMVQMPMAQMPMSQMPMSQMPMNQIPMGGMQGQGMSMVPVQMMPQGMQGMTMMPMMPMQQMPMMQGMPVGGCGTQGVQQMPMMMMPMMSGGQHLQSGQQMMMIPVMQGGVTAPAVSPSSRERSRSRSR